MPELPPQIPEFSRPLRLDRLSKARPYAFEETPSEAEMQALANLFQAISVRKMRFEGTVAPFGRDGWQLDGRLGATVTQACVVTLAPVRTRIDLDVTRRFLPEAEDAAFDLDDDIEPLTPSVDLGLIATEALALALPAYPRAENAPAILDEPESAGETPQKPFAALAALKEKMKNNDE